MCIETEIMFFHPSDLVILASYHIINKFSVPIHRLFLLCLALQRKYLTDHAVLSYLNVHINIKFD